MAKTKKQRKGKSYKIIVRKLQKRKDGKRIYYYYNKTDKRIASRADWVVNDDLKIYLNKKYGKKIGKIKFLSGVREYSKLEKAERKKFLETTKAEIDEYRKETGYGFDLSKKGKKKGAKKPHGLSGYFNLSVVTAVEAYVIGAEGFTSKILIKADNKYYLPTELNLIEFRFFVEDVISFFFGLMDEYYTDKELENSSPAVMFYAYDYINKDYPTLRIFDMDLTTSNGAKKEHQTMLTRHLKEISKEYFSGFKKIDIYDYIRRKL